MITKIMSMKTTRIITNNILLLLLILPSGCTQSARARTRSPAEQLSRAALENSFGEPLWGTGLKHSSFGATALQRYFGEQLCGAILGKHFGGQLWGAAQLWGVGAGLRSNFVRQLRLEES